MNAATEAQRFYEQRDRRTRDYLAADFPGRIPVSVHVDAQGCTTQAGQLLTLTLANLLARAHQRVSFSLAVTDAPLTTPSLCAADTLGDELSRLLVRIDPYGQFAVTGRGVAAAGICIGVGPEARRDLRWYLGLERSIGELANRPLALGQGESADLRGAGLAAILGAAAVFKEALAIKTRPVRMSAWNFVAGAEADAGPAELPPIDVGRGLMIGAGAVAAGVSFWLMQWGNVSPWTVVDRDIVKLHNTNRGLLFFPADAGWPDGEAQGKVSSLCEYLPQSTPIAQWYDQAGLDEEIFDTVLVLANERHVRTIAAHRNDPVQLHATTGRSWLSQAHRHLLARDDCVRCRMADVVTPRFGCSEGDIPIVEQEQQSDAALPFLSAASGLMLAGLLQRLQLGCIDEHACNTWRWDFRAESDLASMGRHRCRSDCSTLLPAQARRAISVQTRWADEAWLSK